MSDIDRMLAKFRKEPEKWLEQSFGMRLWEKQVEILRSTFENRYTACKSCFASGKSYLAAAATIAWLHLFPESIVITTAPSARQVRLNVWQNISMIHRDAKGPLGSELLQTELRCGPGWYAFGFSTDDPEKLQGVHAKSGRILIVVDESAGVDERIHNRITALMTSKGAHRLDIGNPLDPEGSFYQMFSDPKYRKFTISAYDTPNVKNDSEEYPGLVTKEWVDERLDEWGSESPLFKSHVLGEFPDSSENTLIPLSWIKMAQDRWHDVEPEGPIVGGMDPGGGGLAESVLCHRQGRYVYPLHVGAGLASPEIVGMIPKYGNVKDPVYIDQIGVGFGVVGQAKECGYNVKGVNVQVKPRDVDRFVNTRAELYWKLRDRLDPSKEFLWALPPHDDTLANQLGSIRYKIADSGGKVQVESKKEMKHRGLPSPDRADALMLTTVGEGVGHSTGFGVLSGHNAWMEDFGSTEMGALASGWGDYL